MPAKTIQDLDAELSAGRASARALVDAALARATDPTGEGPRVFIKLWAEEARRSADAQDLLRKNGAAASPLAGIPVSLKDLFDVAGETTLAGSKALRDAAPARKDAAIVQRLKAAGAVLVGRTNMTEFAFSAIGYNPHYGTPGNPWDRARVPGGSSSGAAVSVADGMCVAAIGSDTGGSVRIPAALCGLVGFKPTQARVPLEGALPLSTTLDSIGPLARTIADCALVDALLAGESPSVPESIGPAGLHLAVPKTLVLDDLDRDVGTSFERALGALSRAGARITEIDMPELREVVEANAKGGFSPVEALAWHEELLASRGEEYDARVRARIEGGDARRELITCACAGVVPSSSPAPAARRKATMRSCCRPAPSSRRASTRSPRTRGSGNAMRCSCATPRSSIFSTDARRRCRCTGPARRRPGSCSSAREWGIAGFWR